MTVEQLKKYWWLIPLVGYLGIGQFFEGLQPIFRFQLEAHAEAASKQISENSNTIQVVACIQIVAGYIMAKQEGNAVMIAHWTTQAGIHGCVLPDI